MYLYIYIYIYVYISRDPAAAGGSGGKCCPSAKSSRGSSRSTRSHTSRDRFTDLCKRRLFKTLKFDRILIKFNDFVKIKVSDR